MQYEDEAEKLKRLQTSYEEKQMELKKQRDDDLNNIEDMKKQMAIQAQELQEKLRRDAQIEIKKQLEESELKRKEDELKQIEDVRRAQEEEEKRQQLELL